MLTSLTWLQLFFSFTLFPGLLPEDELNKLVESGQSKFAIPVGYPLEVVVKEKPREEMMYCSLDFAKCYRPFDMMPPVRVEELQPGHVVAANIKRILGDGFVVEFAKQYQGVVHHSHIGHDLLAEEWPGEYEVGQRVMARIICVNPDERRIALSMKAYLVEKWQDQWLGNTLDYSKVPRDNNEIVTADVRRLAYGQVYMYCKLLDPQFLYKDEVKPEEKTEEDDKREDLLKSWPAKSEAKLKHLIPIRVSVEYFSDILKFII